MAASWRRPQGVSTHGAWLVCALMSALSVHVRAVLPTGVISLQLHHAAKPQFSDLLASPSSSAGWGVPLPEIQNSRWKHVHMQALDDADPVGCTSYSLPSFAVPMHLTNDPYKTLVVVDRGNCSFLQKTQLATAAGARGLVVRGTKKAVYDAVRSQNHTNATSSGREKPAFEYDCNNGEAFVATKADPEWLTDDSRCSADAKCQSKSCVLTGHEDEHRGGFQVCCLWDTHILMGVGNRTEAKNVSIPVVYVTIADGKQLERSLVKYPELLMRTYDRSVPFLDVSSMLLWALGVVTAIGAAYYSASAEREHYRCRTDPEYLARRAQEHQQQLDDGQSQHRREQETLEIDGRTAVGFIVCAALFLTVFYYIKIAKLIPILFALSAVGSLTQVLMAPTLHACFPAVASRQIFVPVVNEALPLSEILGLMISAASSVVWFVHRRSAWYLQDLFGVVLCFLFLKTVQLPNLKVATILLSLAFCYDIFFVFISPLVFGSSVMEDVATGGAPAYTRDDYPGVDYCERYPTYEPCVDPEPMPMLLVLPRIMNWLGGVSMLGLGDIILPGLLLSYVLRFDYSPQSLGENYFRSVSIGYAVGLAMANLAVTITQVGQPALMYLVPTCLGTLLVLAKWNGDLKAMWLGVAMKDEDFEKSFDTDAVVPSAVHLEIAGTTQSPHDHAPLLGSGGLVTPR